MSKRGIDATESAASAQNNGSEDIGTTLQNDGSENMGTSLQSITDQIGECHYNGVGDGLTDDCVLVDVSGHVATNSKSRKVAAVMEACVLLPSIEQSKLAQFDQLHMELLLLREEHDSLK